MSASTQITNHRRTAVSVLGMVFALAALQPLTARAEPIPELPEITSAAAAVNPDLLPQRAKLVSDRNALRDRVNRHNAACSEVEAGSAEDEKCTRAYGDIAVAVDSHIKVSNDYLQVYRAAEQAAAGIVPQPNTDPSVVDARNVPSGLPQSVNDAIPHTPSGDRVRKGFLAIQEGDWKVALAWFEDARKKEPGNPGIKRLVDLAQFTYQYRALEQAQMTRKDSTPSQPSSLHNPQSSADGEKAKPASPSDQSSNTVALAAASQMAARARADAAYKRYVGKYGTGDPVGRAREVEKAARGEGYSKEELKAQLQKALMDYQKNYRQNHPGGAAESVDGGAPIEEIAIGGKG